MREFVAIMASGTLWPNEAAALAISLVMECHGDGTTMQQGMMNDALANSKHLAVSALWLHGNLSFGLLLLPPYGNWKSLLLCSCDCLGS
jgi:hypothetical protein